MSDWRESYGENHMAGEERLDEIALLKGSKLPAETTLFASANTLFAANILVRSPIVLLPILLPTNTCFPRAVNFFSVSGLTRD